MRFSSISFLLLGCIGFSAVLSSSGTTQIHHGNTPHQRKTLERKMLQSFESHAAPAESSSSSETQWIAHSGSQWDKEFTKGEWDYMDAVPMERMRLAAIGSGLTRLYGLPMNGTILDVGCGEGIITEYLTTEQQKNYIGVDISKVAIDHAIKKRGSPMTWVVSMAHEYTPPRPVDVIIFSEVLYYVDHKKVLQQYEKYLTPNGKIIISMYCEEKKETMYSDIKDFSRSYFQLLDNFELIGTTYNPDPTRVHIRVDVIQKKKVQNVV
jgi:2-polyprenyl-3-methyl-5-hydroxy-6-metoxy-1,4-benzoquinol methylase